MSVNNPIDLSRFDSFTDLYVVESINARTLPAVVLRLWLSDLDMNSLAVMLGSDFNVSADWLFLALSAMGMQPSCDDANYLC